MTMPRIVSTLIALTFSATAAAAQGIGLAGADDAPSYNPGSAKYRMVATMVMTGGNPVNSTGELQINVAIATVRPDVLDATLTLVTPESPVTNGMQAVQRMNANGKMVSYEMVNPKDKDAPLYVEAYRGFLPPMPSSWAVGTEWTTLETRPERTLYSDAFSSMKQTDKETVLYKVVADTIVGGTRAKKVTFDQTVVTTTVNRSFADKPETSTDVRKGNGFHLFAMDGRYLGSRKASDQTIGAGKDQVRITTTQAIDIVR